jgi:hypothetical protein
MKLAAVLIGPALILSASGVVPRFDFVSAPSRLSFVNVSGDDGQEPILEPNGQGLCAIDFDGDTRLDLYFVNGSTLRLWREGRSPRGALLRNLGNRRFEDVTHRAGVRGPPWGTGCAAADYDGDGHTDLFVAGWRESVLYRNRGNGVFEDVTRRVGLRVAGFPSSAAFADLDGDGRLDLAVSRYVEFDPESYPRDEVPGRPCHYKGFAGGCPPLAYLPEHTLVFRQTPEGRFEDQTADSALPAAITRGFGIAALPLFASSRLPDLYVVCDQMLNRLFRNLSSPGRLRFEEVGEERGAALADDGEAESGMGLAVGDVWERGLPDLFVTNFAFQKNTLYRNRGESFEDATLGTGLEAHPNELGWGTALADFDADSHLDAVVANGHVYPQVALLRDPLETYEQPLRLYAGDGGGVFEEVHVPALEEPRGRRGLVVADLDNDGRLEIVTQTHRGRPQIFWNRSGRGNHWIRFELVGGRPRDPIGARLTVTLPDGTRRTGWRLPNQGYQSSQDPRVFFGLGRDARVSAVEVTWPDGLRESHGPLRADRDYRIHRGKRPEAVPPADRAPPEATGRLAPSTSEAAGRLLHWRDH